jgi:hypothetical protein
MPMNEQEFDLAIRAELEPSESVVWRTASNVEAVRGSLLSFSVLWLSGLFMLGVGVLRTAEDDSHVLFGLIALLAIVAVAGSLELIFVPRRAGRTLYVLTDRRIFSLCVTKRLFSQDVANYRDKEVLRVSKSSIPFFYLSNLPSQIMFFILTYDVLSSLMYSFDTFIAIGFGMTMLGWLQPWLQDMRIPIPKYRDAPRTFYSVGDLFVFLESFRLEEIAEFVYRKGRENAFNAFVISKSSGCIRMRSIPEVKPLELAIAQVSKS